MPFPSEIRCCWLLTGLVLVFGAGFPSAESSADCPSTCFCNLPSRIVYCSRRGLTSIPSGIAPDTLQLNLNANGFHSTVLQRANFTGYASLEHLYLSECGIERIEVGTFAALGSLKWLDLSNNRIRTLGADALSGLDLQHLFLNGNRHIRLVPESFRGLVTTGLYLHDCSLVRLAPEVLGPLNASLKYLWLNGNEIDRFEARFAGVFSTLQHLRLASNPLHCNCEVLWLKEFFDRGADVFKGAVAPSCLTPHRLRGKFFNQLSLFDFRCQSPMFNNIETTFGRNTGRLKCTASGDPAPVLYWIQPSGKTSKYGPPPPDEEETRKTEGVLTLRNDDGTSNLFGMYICIANNDAGNVTLTINVSWPLLSNESPGLLPPLFPSSEKDDESVLIPSADEGSLLPWWQQRSISIPFHSSSSSSSSSSSQPAVLQSPTGNERAAGRTPPSSSSSSSSVRVSHGPPTAGQLNNYSIVGQVDLRSSDPLPPTSSKSRLFTVTELVCAVVGTHLATLALCAVAVPVYYRARWRTTATTARKNRMLPAAAGGQGHEGSPPVAYSSRPPPPPPQPQHQQLLQDEDRHVDRMGRHVTTQGGGGGESTHLTSSSSAGGRINSRFLTDYLIDNGSFR